MELELIEDYEIESAFAFLTSILGLDLTSEDIEVLIEEFGSDQDIINHKLEEIYPSKKYFVLNDYVDDRNCGYFHIRIWSLLK